MNAPVAFLATPPWRDAESMLATSFGLRLIDAVPEMLALCEKEIEQSDFSPDDVEKLLPQDRSRLIAFATKWYAHCQKHEYGEEWDPAEGNQQEDSPPPELVGIGQGFLVTYSIFFLYAKSNPAGLLSFIKRRRIPHAQRVAKDILRVFNDKSPPSIHA